MISSLKWKMIAILKVIFDLSILPYFLKISGGFPKTYQLFSKRRCSLIICGGLQRTCEALQNEKIYFRCSLVDENKLIIVSILDIIFDIFFRDMSPAHDD